MIRITTFAGRRVAVFGLGASGIATAKALVDGGADVVCSDDNAAGVKAAAEAGLKTADLKEANWAVFSALVLAPGVPLTHPEPHWTAHAAKLAGVEVIGDLELFGRERRAQTFDVPLIAITGTNGKSTTTALTAHILKEAGRDTQVGGNIGTAMLSLQPFAPGRHYVIECSSYQIDLAPTLDPSVGVLLNVTPDHLDRHGTIENYAAVKARLVKGAAQAFSAWCAPRSEPTPARAAISVAAPPLSSTTLLPSAPTSPTASARVEMRKTIPAPMGAISFSALARPNLSSTPTTAQPAPSTRRAFTAA